MEEGWKLLDDIREDLPPPPRAPGVSMVTEGEAARYSSYVTWARHIPPGWQGALDHRH